MATRLQGLVDSCVPEAPAFVKAKGDRSELETAFVEAPGNLLSNARLSILKLLDPHMPLETLEVMDRLATGVVLPCGRRARPSARNQHFFCGPSGLFTWNGDFGAKALDLQGPTQGIRKALAWLTSGALLNF